MPHDRLKLDPTPDLAVMIRTLCLPTTSARQARRIARLQLDRLSPIPPDEALWDLVRLRIDGTEGVFALGLIRKAELGADEPRRIARRSVEGQDVVFQFRNRQATSRQEAKLLSRAPGLMLTALCAAAVSLSLATKVGEWRDVRLQELAQAMRDQRNELLRKEETISTRRVWMALSNTDAALQWLCVTARLRQENAHPIPVASVDISKAGIGLITRDEPGVSRLQLIGGEATSVGDGATRIAITPETCR